MRTTRAVGTLVVTLFALLCAAAFAGARANQRTGAGAAFPLAAGTSWVYQGVVRWKPGSGAVAQEKMVQWTMTVERVIRRGSLVAAVVSGFPQELNGTDGSGKPAASLIVEEAGGKYYRIGPDGFSRALARLENSKDSLDGLVTDDEIFLALPLARGKRFCNASGMIRTDQFYCWVVGKPEAADLTGVKGVSAARRTAFPVQFLTATENTAFDFVPGIGITSYTYHRHGEMADTELQLVEFHRGGN